MTSNPLGNPLGNPVGDPLGNPVDIGVDANGCLTETTNVGGVPVIVHHDDIPESDIVTIRGLRVTTPVRTAIDLAASLPPAELDLLVTDLIGRGLMTREEVRARIDQPDMRARRGAQVLRGHLGL